MKAMIIRRYGGPEAVERGEIATPRPGRGKILVRVRGSSVNPLDCGIRAGMLKSFIRLRLPAVLGVDVAREVVLKLGGGYVPPRRHSHAASAPPDK
jgi:NADPH:quinone reductase-like Zn-dependent oxidoreductase